MMFFAHDVKCHKCGVSFKSFSENSSRPVRPVCSSCKKVEKVIDLGGDENLSCGSCIHFKKFYDKNLGMTNNFWGRCSKGYVLSNESEYALGNEVLGLVYFEDVCEDFCNKSREV
jgi:endogenous inhibitor of DNA gyrase (YacG/DUF329 family)